MQTATLYTTEQIPFPYYGFQSYRIEVDISNPMRPLQRHVWKSESGETDKVDDWIDSAFPSRMTPDRLIERGFMPNNHE